MTAWIPRRPEYYIRTGSMFENPHGVPRDEILRMIASGTPEVVAQTVFGKYVESSGLVFTGELIQQMIDRTIPVVLGDVYLNRAVRDAAWAERKYYEDRYVNPFHTGVDFARQTDYTVISTLDCRTMPARLVYWKRLNRVPWEAIYAEVGRAVHFWGPSVLCDGTGPGGDTAMDALWGRDYCATHHRCVFKGSRCMERGEVLNCNPADYYSLSTCDDYDFGGGTGMKKKELVEHHRNVLSVGYQGPDVDEPFGWVRIPPIPQIEEEHTFYTWDDKKLETDCLMSLALATWQGLESPVGDAVVGGTFGS